MLYPLSYGGKIKLSLDAYRLTREDGAPGSQAVDSQELIQGYVIFPGDDVRAVPPLYIVCS
jgi:hypothetical protein